MGPAVLWKADLIKTLIRRIRKVDFVSLGGNFLGRIPVDSVVIDGEGQVNRSRERISPIAPKVTKCTLVRKCDQSKKCER